MRNLFSKKIIAFSFVIFFFSFFLVKADLLEREREIMASTVNLVCINERDNVSMMGTGIIIDPLGYVLTNKHVAENSNFCYVYYSQGLGQEANKSFRNTAFLIEGSNSYDLFLLKIEGYNRGHYLDISIQPGSSQDYRDAFYYGYPSRQPGEEERTYLLSKRIGPIFDISENHVLVSLEASLGASGSGVFWEDGSYLGTLYAISDDGYIIKSVPANKVHEFIASLIEESKMNSSIYNVKPSYTIDHALSVKLSGKILLQVESHGEAWYVYPGNNSRIFLGRPIDAFNVMRNKGLGVSNENLRRIPVSLDYLSGQDSNNDGLPDAFKEALGLRVDRNDSDGDGYDDYTELLHGYDPLGPGKLSLDENFSRSLAGQILLQVESHGEAWYVNPDNNERYFLGRPADAFNLMRNLGLGISNENLNKILIYN
jgi:hypothetical protein